MIDLVVEMEPDVLLHKLNVISNNLGLLTWVSDKVTKVIEDKKVTTWVVSKKYFFLIYYAESISITVISSDNESELIVIGGGMENGKDLEKEFLKQLRKNCSQKL